MAESAQRSKRWKWWVCGLLLLATMINYMDRQTLANVALRIQFEFDLNDIHYGNIEMVFGYAFAAGLLIFGFIADRVSVMWLYPVVLTGWSLAGFATGLADNYEHFLICRIALGLFEAGHWPCAMKTAQRLLERKDRTLGNSVLQSGASIGAILTPLIMIAMLASLSTPIWQMMDKRLAEDATPETVAAESTKLLRARAFFNKDINATHLQTMVQVIQQRMENNATLKAAGAAEINIRPKKSAKVTAGMRDRYKGQMFVPGAWRPPFFVIGGIGLAWVVLWLVMMRRRDFETATTSDAPATGITLGQVVRDRRFTILLAMGVCINIPWQLIRAWLPKILQEGRGYTEQAALLFNSAYYIATDVGCLAAGAASLWLVKRTGCAVHQARVRVFGVCAALIALTTLAAQLPKGWPLLGVLLVIGAASLGVFPCAYSFKQDLAREHMGKITGLIGAGAWIAASPCQKLFGWMRYATGSYDLGLAIVGWMPLIALLLLIFFWPQDKPAD